MGVQLRLLPLIYCNRYCCSKNQYLAGNWLLVMGKTLWQWLEIMLVTPTLGTPEPPKNASLSKMGLKKPRVKRGNENEKHTWKRGTSASPTCCWSRCGVQGTSGVGTGWCLCAAQVHPCFIAIIRKPWNQLFQEAPESPERSQVSKHCVCVEKQECLNVWGSISSSSGISLRTAVKITWISCRLTWANPSLINTIRNRGQRTKFCPGLYWLKPCREF